MKWVTRARPKTDRIACPWLIRRFLDPGAEILYVPADQVLTVEADDDAVGFDTPGARYDHRDGKCTFEVLIDTYGLGDDPALVRLARIVHAADIADELGTDPFAPALLALAVGGRGACGSATCAEFLHHTKPMRDTSGELEFTGPTCNLRDIDLGIAVGAAVKTVTANGIDWRCQTRIATAARKLGIITAAVAVSRSLSMTPKSVGYDRSIPAVDVGTLDLPATGTLPIGEPGAARYDGARNRQQPRHPIR